MTCCPEEDHTITITMEFFHRHGAVCVAGATIQPNSGCLTPDRDRIWGLTFWKSSLFWDWVVSVSLETPRQEVNLSCDGPKSQCQLQRMIVSSRIDPSEPHLTISTVVQTPQTEIHLPQCCDTVIPRARGATFTRVCREHQAARAYHGFEKTFSEE